VLINKSLTLIVGYQPAWVEYAAEEIQFDKLTHINFAFIRPTMQGGLIFQDASYEPRLAPLVSDAHARGVRVLISVGGWMDGNNPEFEAIAEDASLTAAFVNNLVSFVRVYNLDGVDMDWEFPEADSAQNYANMMSRLSQAMREQGKLLTAAVHAGAYFGRHIMDEVFGYVDFLYLMAYEGGHGSDHSPYEYAVESLNYWIDTRHLPSSKAVLGVPFYGRPLGTSYAELVAYDPQASDRDVTNYPDPDNPANLVAVYYNGIPTMKRKTVLALERGAGVMAWELSQDAVGKRSLLQAIFETVQSQPRRQ
jgi:chitinase